MGEKWRDRGPNTDWLDVMTFGLSSAVFGEDHTVEDERGELHTVYVGRGQSVGEAIAEGQFRDRDGNLKKR
jgi:hypothetical protein